MKLILPLLVVSMLILAGCGQETAGPSLSPYAGGWKGVIASFEDMGVVSDIGNINEVYENEQFPVDVRVENNGEFELAAGDIDVQLKGVDPGQFGLPSGIISNAGVLERVSEFLPEGGEEVMSFGNAQYDVTGLFYLAHFYATVEYPYKTFVAVTDVCYKEDLRDRSVCNVESSKSSFSSGAPITVTSVKESPAGRGQFYLEYKISNLGGGKVKANAADDYSSVYGEVLFDMKTDTSEWECVSRGNTNIVRLTNGEGVIRCKYPKSGSMPEDTLFTKQVDLDLTYIYQSTIDTEVKILENIQ